MTTRTLTIWSNLDCDPPARAALEAGVGPHRLRWAETCDATTMPLGRPDPQLAFADVAFGQPEAEQCAALPRLTWVHLSSAGYTSFDTRQARAALTGRDARLTTSSSVYAEPCAQHVLAFLLAEARQLYKSHADQLGPRTWPKIEFRSSSVLLRGQQVLLVGFGAIARRLNELCAPFSLQLRRCDAARAAMNRCRSSRSPSWSGCWQQRTT